MNWVNAATGEPLSFGYFHSREDAEEWLSPDADEAEIEQYSFNWPDQFEEWQRRMAGRWPS